MAINITKLINAVSGIVGNLDSDNTVTELNRGTIAAQQVNDARDALSFATVADFETADSTNEGNIVYANSTKQYYVSIHDRWAPITLTGPATTAPATAPFYFQGSNNFFLTGGYDAPPGSNVGTSQVSTYSFSNGSTQSNNFDLALRTYNHAGASSSTTGYTMGGFNLTPATPPFASTYLNSIQKFPFTAPSTATDQADLTVARSNVAGAGNGTSGYCIGGSSPTIPGNDRTTIDKFPMSSETNATDVGDLTFGRYLSKSSSSPTNAYVFGGYEADTTESPSSPSPSSWVTGIHKFPFASDTNATDIGDTPVGMVNTAATGSTTKGYQIMGSQNSAETDPASTPSYGNGNVFTLTYASDTVGTLPGWDGPTGRRQQHSAFASTDKAVVAGGIADAPPFTSPSPGAATDDTESFPFASETTRSFLGNMNSPFVPSNGATIGSGTFSYLFNADNIQS